MLVQVHKFNLNGFIAYIHDQIPNLIPRLITNYVTGFKQEQGSQSLVTALHTYFGSTPRFDPKMNSGFDLDMNVITSVDLNLDPDAKPRNIRAAVSHNSSKGNLSLVTDVDTGIVPTILPGMDQSVLKLSPFVSIADTNVA